MIHYIWIFMILSGVVAAALQGKLELVTKAALNGAEEGVSVCLGLISIMVFWLGMMRIAQDAGLLEKLAKILRPVARFCFHPCLMIIRRWATFYRT